MADLIVKGVAANLSTTFVDQDGTAIAAVGTVTCDITYGDGSVLVTGRATTNTLGTGVYTVALTATETANLNCLTLNWKDGAATRQTTYVDILDKYYFSIAEAYASDETIKQDRFDSNAILTARKEVMEEFRRICSVSFVQYYSRETFSGDGTSNLFLTHRYPRTIRTVRHYTDIANGIYTSFSATDIAAITMQETGKLTKTDGTVWNSGGSNYVIEYEHGMQSIPAEVKRVSFLRLRYRLSMGQTPMPDRATSVSMSDGFSFRLDSPSLSTTGYSEVDAVLDRYSLMPIAVA